MNPKLKSEVLRLLETLPADATWDDVANLFEVRAKIERGLADLAAGRTYTSDEIRRHFRRKYTFGFLGEDNVPVRSLTRQADEA